MKPLVRLLTVFTVTVFALMLSACAFDSSNDTDQRDLDDRNELVRSFSAIQGIYSGTIETQYKTMPAKLTITYREVEIGKDSDGQPRYRPVLVARLSRPELLTLDVRMNGKYIERTGDLTLSTVDNGGEYLQGRGYIRGTDYTATLTNASFGFYGTLRVSLLSREIKTEENDDQEQISRIRQRMKLLEGTYRAVVKLDIPSPDYPDVVRSELRLIVEETGAVPVLTAFYSHMCGAIKPIRARATYKPDLVPAELSFATTSDMDLRITFNGTWQNSVIDGYFQFPTLSGRLHAVPKQPGDRACKPMPGDTDVFDPPRVDPTPTPAPTPKPTPAPKPTPKPRRGR